MLDVSTIFELIVAELLLAHGADPDITEAPAP